MSTRIDNEFWMWVDVEPDVAGSEVLAQVKENEPLRRGILVTVDMATTPPMGLVEDRHGQHWTIQVSQIWIITDEDPLGQ